MSFCMDGRELRNRLVTNGGGIRGELPTGDVHVCADLQGIKV